MVVCIQIQYESTNSGLVNRCAIKFYVLPQLKFIPKITKKLPTSSTARYVPLLDTSFKIFVILTTKITSCKYLLRGSFFFHAIFALIASIDKTELHFCRFPKPKPTNYNLAAKLTGKAKLCSLHCCCLYNSRYKHPQVMPQISNNIGSTLPLGSINHPLADELSISCTIVWFQVERSWEAGTLAGFICPDFFGDFLDDILQCTRVPHISFYKAVKHCVT